MLVAAIADTSGIDPDAVDVANARLNVTIAGLRSADGASSAMPAVTLVVGGTWGTPTAPAIVSITAYNSGGGIGPGANDSLVVQFDQNVTRYGMTTLNDSQVRQLLVFDPPFEGYCGNVSYSGKWATSSTLQVVLGTCIPATTSFTSATSPWLPWNVKSLRISVPISADVCSANGESPPSNASAVVSAGSWGDVPAVLVTPASSTTINVHWSAPTSATGYAVTLFGLVWSADGEIGPSALAVPSITTLQGLVSWVAVSSSGSSRL